MLFWGLALGGLLGLVLLLLWPLRLEIDYHINEPGSWLVVHVSYAGRHRYVFSPLPIHHFLPLGKLLLPARDLRPEGDATLHPENTFVVLPWIMRFWQELLQSTRCVSFSLKVEVGLEDPALTALAYGLLWNAAVLLYFNIRSRTHWQPPKPRIEILPCFRKTLFASRLHCIFILAPAHIITAGLRVLTKYKG